MAKPDEKIINNIAKAINEDVNIYPQNIQDEVQKINSIEDEVQKINSIEFDVDTSGPQWGVVRLDEPDVLDEQKIAAQLRMLEQQIPVGRYQRLGDAIRQHGPGCPCSSCRIRSINSNQTIRERPTRPVRQRPANMVEQKIRPEPEPVKTEDDVPSFGEVGKRKLRI